MDLLCMYCVHVIYVYIYIRVYIYIIHNYTRTSVCVCLSLRVCPHMYMGTYKTTTIGFRVCSCVLHMKS